MKLNIKNLFFIALFSSAFVSVNAQIQNTSEFREAMKSMSSSDYESAVSALTPLLSGSYSSAAMAEIGKIRFKQAEAETSAALTHYYEAAGFLNSGIETGGVKGPETPKLLYDLGTIYEERLKDYPNAMAVYLKLINAYPNFMTIDKVYYNLAVCCETLGRYDDAAQYYGTVVSDYPHSTFFSSAQEKMRKLAPSTNSRNSALEIQENIADDASDENKMQANIDLGDMQLESGNYKNAVSAYKNALKSAGSPEDAVNVYRKMVTVMEEKQKDYQGAVEAVEEMMQKYPNVQGAEDLVYKVGRMYETDVDSMKKTVDADGRIRYRKSRDNMEKALNYYDTVTEKYPDSEAAADAYLRKAEIFSKELKDYDQAKEAYSEFLRKYPEHSEAAEIRKKLDELQGY